jgi:translation initiation factor IF-2
VHGRPGQRAGRGQVADQGAAGAGPGVVGRDPQAARAVGREPRGVGQPPGRGPRPPAAGEVDDDERALAALGQPLVPGRPHAAARQGQHRVQGQPGKRGAARAGPVPGAAVVVLDEAAVPGRGHGPDVRGRHRAGPVDLLGQPGGLGPGAAVEVPGAEARHPVRRGAEGPDVGRAEDGHAAQHRMAVPPLGHQPAAAVPVHDVAAAVAHGPDVGRRRRARVADEVGQPGRQRPGPPGPPVPPQGDRRPAAARVGSPERPRVGAAQREDGREPGGIGRRAVVPGHGRAPAGRAGGPVGGRGGGRRPDGGRGGQEREQQREQGRGAGAGAAAGHADIHPVPPRPTVAGGRISERLGLARAHGKETPLPAGTALCQQAVCQAWARRCLRAHRTADS